jgi:hypothetical protein
MRWVVVPITVVCCVLSVGQSSTETTSESSPPAGQKTKNPYGLGMGTKGVALEGADVLSDTQGVKFGPYVRGVIQEIKRNWYDSLPPSEERRGKLAIEFAITKEGELAEMFLVARPGGPDDETMVRTAWSSITKSSPFPPLPKKFAGSFLSLRVRFYYNPNKID